MCRTNHTFQEGFEPLKPSPVYATGYNYIIKYHNDLGFNMVQKYYIILFFVILFYEYTMYYAYNTNE